MARNDHSILRMLRNHPWWTGLAAGLVLFLLVAFLVLPPVFRLGLEQWLESQGDIQAQIEDVDFNLFTGDLTIESLLARRQERGRIRWTRAELELAWLPIRKKRIRLDDIALQNALVTVTKEEDGDLVVGGITFAGAENGKGGFFEDWEIGFGNIDLIDVTLRYRGPYLTQEIYVQKGHVDPMLPWVSEASSFELALRLEEGTIDIAGTIQPSPEKIDLELDLAMRDLPLEWTAPILQESEIKDFGGTLFSDMTIAVSAGDMQELSLDGSIRIEDLRGEAIQGRLAPFTVAWDGRMDVSIEPSGIPKFSAEGEFNAANLRFLAQDPKLGLRIGKFTLAGKYQSVSDTEEIPFRFKGDASVSGLGIRDPAQDLVLAQVDQILLKETNLEGLERIQSDSLRVHEASLLERRGTVSAKDGSRFVLNLSTFGMDNFELSLREDRLHLGEISLTDAQILVQRTEAGRFEALDLLPSFLDQGRPELTTQKDMKTTQETSWNIETGTIDLKDVVIRYRDPSLDETLLVQSGHLDPISFWDPETKSKYSLEFALREGTVRLAGSVQPNAQPPVLKGNLSVDNLPLDWTAGLVEEAGLAGFGGSLSTEASVSLLAGNLPELRLDGSVTLRKLRGNLPQASLLPLTLSWDGKVQVALPAQGPQQIYSDGTLSASGLHVLSPSFGLRLKADNASVTGNFQAGTREIPENAPFVFTGFLSTANPLIVNEELEQTLVRAAGISMVNIRATGMERISAQRVTLDRADLLKRPAAGEEAEFPYVFSLDRLSIAGLGMDQSRRHMDLGRITLSGGRVLIAKTEEGLYEAFDLIPSALQEGKKDDKQEEVQNGWSYSLARVEIEQDSQARFVDFSVKPRVDISFPSVFFRIENLDTTAPQQKAPVRMEIALGDYGTMHAQGTVQPLQEELSMDVRGEIKEFDMIQVTGYAEHYIGYAVQSGQLYSDFRMRMVKEELDSEVKLFITKLKLNRLREEELEEFANQLGVPLSSALNLVRGKEGNIEITLPIQGDMDKPDIQFSTVIAQALRKATFSALKTAALSYFAPVGAVYVASKLFGRLVALRLDPVPFQPGQTTLNQQHTDYLNEVVDKLEDRPEVRLLLCGQAVPDDISALRDSGTQEGGSGRPSLVPREMLLELARSRAESVKEYFVGQGIASGRLVMCAPQFEQDEDARPLVELAI